MPHRHIDQPWHATCCSLHTMTALVAICCAQEALPAALCLSPCTEPFAMLTTDALLLLPIFLAAMYSSNVSRFCSKTVIHIRVFLVLRKICIHLEHSKLCSTWQQKVPSSHHRSANRVRQRPFSRMADPGAQQVHSAAATVLKDPAHCNCMNKGRRTSK